MPELCERGGLREMGLRLLLHEYAMNFNSAKSCVRMGIPDIL